MNRINIFFLILGFFVLIVFFPGKNKNLKVSNLRICFYKNRSEFKSFAKTIEFCRESIKKGNKFEKKN